MVPATTVIDTSTEPTEEEENEEKVAKWVEQFNRQKDELAPRDFVQLLGRTLEPDTWGESGSAKWENDFVLYSQGFWYAKDLLVKVKNATISPDDNSLSQGEILHRYAERLINEFEIVLNHNDLLQGSEIYVEVSEYYQDLEDLSNRLDAATPDAAVLDTQKEQRFQEDISRSCANKIKEAFESDNVRLQPRFERVIGASDSTLPVLEQSNYHDWENEFETRAFAFAYAVNTLKTTIVKLNSAEPELSIIPQLGQAIAQFREILDAFPASKSIEVEIKRTNESTVKITVEELLDSTQRDFEAKAANTQATPISLTIAQSTPETQSQPVAAIKEPLETTEQARVAAERPKATVETLIDEINAEKDSESLRKRLSGIVKNVQDRSMDQYKNDAQKLVDYLQGNLTFTNKATGATLRPSSLRIFNQPQPANSDVDEQVQEVVNNTREAKKILIRFGNTDPYVPLETVLVNLKSLDHDVAIRPNQQEQS